MAEAVVPLTSDQCERLWQGAGRSEVLGCDDAPDTEIDELPRLEDDYIQITAEKGFRGDQFRCSVSNLQAGGGGRQVGVNEVPQVRRRWLVGALNWQTGGERFYPGSLAPLSLIGTEHLHIRKAPELHDGFEAEGPALSTVLKRRLSVPGVDFDEEHLKDGADLTPIPKTGGWGFGEHPRVVAERSRRLKATS